MNGSDHGAAGRDATGAVTVVVDGTGVAESIQVHPDWRRLVGAEAFAAAVTEAGRNSVQALWGGHETEAADPGVPSEAARLETQPGGMPVAGPAPYDARVPADDIWRAFEAAHRHARYRATAAEVGQAGFGRLTLTFDVSGALVCEADPEWVGRQETGEISYAAESALASLRAAREEGRAMWRDLVTAVARLGSGGRRILDHPAA